MIKFRLFCVNGSNHFESFSAFWRICYTKMGSIEKKGRIDTKSVHITTDFF